MCLSGPLHQNVLVLEKVQRETAVVIKGLGVTERAHSSE